MIHTLIVCVANPATSSSDPEALLPPPQEIKNFSYLQLATATNNFSLDARIGQGGFGDVYKGKLEIDGQVTVVFDQSNHKQSLELLLLLSL